LLDAGNNAADIFSEKILVFLWARKSNQVDSAWCCQPAVEFETASDINLALLQVDLNRVKR